jgi:hypothetical protein
MTNIDETIIMRLQAASKEYQNSLAGEYQSKNLNVKKVGNLN